MPWVVKMAPVCASAYASLMMLTISQFVCLDVNLYNMFSSSASYLYISFAIISHRLQCAINMLLTRAILYGKPMAESADYARSAVVIYDDAHDSVHASA